MKPFMLFLCLSLTFSGCSFVKLNLDGSVKNLPYERKLL